MVSKEHKQALAASAGLFILAIIFVPLSNGYSILLALPIAYILYKSFIEYYVEKLEVKIFGEKKPKEE